MAPEEPAPSIDIRPLLTAAALGVAVVLPGGLTLGAAALAVAPHLGIDPDGTAKRRVRASLQRDSRGLFNFVIREDAHGMYMAAVDVSDVADERAQLEVGDRIYSIDGARVRADEPLADVPSQEAGPPLVAPLIDFSGEADSADAPPPPGLSLDEVKRLVRASGAAVLVELFREEVRPVSERLFETKTHLEGELKAALELTSPGLPDKLEALRDDLVSTAEEWKSELVESLVPHAHSPVPATSAPDAVSATPSTLVAQPHIGVRLHCKVGSGRVACDLRTCWRTDVVDTCNR